MILTVGTFDGVHRGHLEVLATMKRLAAARRCRPTAVTFDRHPLEIIAPQRAPKQIMSVEKRRQLLTDFGVDVIVVPFDEELRLMTAARWMRELKEKYRASVVVLGYDNTFGCDGRTLTFDDYKELGRQLGLDVVRAAEIDGCSSTAVRKAVENGDMGKAAALLGRPFSICGRVVEGRQLGRTIGVPTANVKTDPRQLLPKNGVYAGVAFVDGREYKAMVNVGCKPTVAETGEITVEAHLLGFSGDLYGKEITVEFDRRIRDEKKFDNLDHLRRQIEADIAQTLTQ